MLALPPQVATCLKLPVYSVPSYPRFTFCLITQYL